MTRAKRTLRAIAGSLAFSMMLVALGGRAQAGPPYPEPISILDPFVVVCPAGDSVFHVQAMGFVGPYPNGLTEVVLCGCPSVQVATPRPADHYTIVEGCRLRIQSDAQGVADFRIRAGGVCSNADIPVTSNAGFLGTRRLVISPDQDGNLIVDDQDLAIIQSKIGTSDLTADLDEDGAVTEADTEVARGHLGHSATSVLAVPNDRASFELLAPRPNPSDGGSTIIFRLPVALAASVEVLDASGRVVRTVLATRELVPGPHSFAWDGRDRTGRPVPAGVYRVRVRAGNRLAERLLIVLR